METNSAGTGFRVAAPGEYERHYRGWDGAILLGVTVAVSLLSINRDSLWIDEGVSVWAASSSSFGLLCERMANVHGSIAQTPFHNIYLWAWAQLFGLGELASRFSNVPWALLLLYTLQVAMMKLYGRRSGWLLMAVSPFLWFYMNEVRPYVAVMALASVATVSVLLYMDNPDAHRRWAPWLCLGSNLLLAGSHMLGVFLIPALVAGLVLWAGFDRERWRVMLRDWLLPAIVFLPLFLALGGYFAWTLHQGTEGSVGTVDLRNLVFPGYEFAGFLGLGPPRNLLRDAPIAGVRIYLGTLALGVAGWLVAATWAVRRCRTDGISKWVALLCGMVVTGVLLFVAAAFVGRLSFWGRHLAQFFPMFILIVVGLMAGDPSRRGARARSEHIATACLAAVWLVSAARLAFLDEYKKDDYRGAVSTVVNAAGDTGSILWAANTYTASYYGLQFGPEWNQIDRPSGRHAECVTKWTEEQFDAAFRERPHPLAVAVSRTDVFDRQNVVERWVAKKNGRMIASLSAFKVYEIPDAVPETH